MIPGEIAEQHEDLVEERIGGVGAAEIGTIAHAGAEHVVVGEKVRIAHVFRRLRECLDRSGVRADLGLGKDHSDPHVLVPPRITAPAERAL